MERLAPIFVVELFPKLSERLLELLKGLSDEDWQRPTLASLWNVKDIAAHLLDGNLRRLSICRDGYMGTPPATINSYRDLVNYINDLNKEWVRVAKRISPRILIELLSESNQQIYQYFRALPPFERASFSVAWAGEEVSLNWFDIARDYTEHWHHQQQIRLAVHRFGIEDRELYYPVLDTFMRALPHHYKKCSAAEGSLLKFHIAGAAGGDWWLLNRNDQWQLVTQPDRHPDTAVTINQEIAWRIFTKGIDKARAEKEITIIGDKVMGMEIINMLAVMA